MRSLMEGGLATSSTPRGKAPSGASRHLPREGGGKKRLPCHFGSSFPRSWVRVSDETMPRRLRTSCSVSSALP